MTSLGSIKDNNNFLPENCFINKLSTTSQANCSAAFSTRLLKANYTGPMVNVRRSSDNATIDFYGNVNGVLGTIINGKGQNLSNWLNGATGFVTIWYDQSGNTGRNLIQPNTTLQPTISGTTITYDGGKQLYNITNTPLTSGLDTYTYICNFTATNFSTSRTICEISPNPITNNNRSGLMQYFSSYGFVGNYNDAFCINNNTTTNRKCVMMCNHNLNTGNVVINDNATIYSSTTNGGPSNLSVVPNAFCVGTNATGGEFFIGDINEVIIFTSTLTTRQSQLYFIPDAITRKNYSSIPKIQLKGIPKDNLPIPSGWRVGFDSQNFSNLTSGNAVTAVWWSNNFDSNFSENTNITPFNSPIYRTATGTNNLPSISQAPYIEFTRASTHYLNCGSRTFNITSNGGFTAVCYVRFTGTGSNYERVFDFGNGQGVDNILFARSGTSSNIYIDFLNGGTSTVTASSGSIVQNEWTLYAVRYNGSNRFTEIYRNGILVGSGTITNVVPNRTLVNTYVARSNWTGEDPASIDIAGLYMYDRLLTYEQISSISNHLVYSTTRNMPNIIPDYSKIFTVGNVLSRGYLRDQAMFFNGDLNSYIDIQDVPNVPLSYSFWFYCTNVTATSTIVGLTNFTRGGNGIQIDILNGNLSVAAALPSAWTQSTNYAVTVNTWYHLTIVVNLSFQVLIYINGSLYQTLTGTTIPTNRSRFIVGASGDTARGYFGYLYDFRVYDYALRASEVSTIQMRSPLQLTLNSNYLVNVSNWYNDMTLYKTGSYTVVQSGSDPDVQIQLLTSGTTSCSNTYYNKNSIQNNSSFVCSFELWTSSATSDALYFYCGSNTSTTNRGLGIDGSYGVSFQVQPNNNTGINLYNSSGTRVASSGLNNWINNFQWIPVTISYTRGTVNTWVINMNGSDIITYSDPSNATWLTTAGNFWGIGAWCNTSSMDAFIRRVELSFTPNTANTSSNSALISYPRGAMTANTTVLSDGTYIASAS
jgi:hypothetical protein